MPACVALWYSNYNVARPFLNVASDNSRSSIIEPQCNAWRLLRDHGSIASPEGSISRSKRPNESLETTIRAVISSRSFWSDAKNGPYEYSTAIQSRKALLLAIKYDRKEQSIVNPKEESRDDHSNRILETKLLNSIQFNSILFNLEQCHLYL